MGMWNALANKYANGNNANWVKQIHWKSNDRQQGILG